ncbi:hypothetical protein Tco_0291187 [Tanacetum coccineum]
MKIHREGCDTRFWLDNWVGGPALKETFPRLFRLEANPSCLVSERAPLFHPLISVPTGTGIGPQQNIGHDTLNGLVFNWSWTRPIRSPTEFQELSDLHSLVAHLRLALVPDTWEYLADDTRAFSVKGMRAYITKDTWKGVIDWWQINSITITTLEDVITLADTALVPGNLKIFFDVVVQTTLFTVGSYVPPPKKTTFMTRIKPLILSPNTTYIMNLVFKKKKPSELYIGLEYEFQEETYYSFLSDEREDGWSTAELFQFSTDQRTTVDELEIRFNIEHFKVIAIEGIEFRPLDDEDTWQKLGNMEPDVAMKKYVTLLAEKVPGCYV